MLLGAAMSAAAVGAAAVTCQEPCPASSAALKSLDLAAQLASTSCHGVLALAAAVGGLCEHCALQPHSSAGQCVHGSRLHGSTVHDPPPPLGHWQAGTAAV